MSSGRDLPVDLDTLRNELGDGPMRFAPVGERSIQEQIDALTEEERKCFDHLREKWETTTAATTTKNKKKESKRKNKKEEDKEEEEKEDSTTTTDQDQENDDDAMTSTTATKANFSDEMILRFARCSPGPKKFNAKTAWKVMKRFDPRYLRLTAGGMEDQLLTQTLFVVPQLKSKDGHDVFYMRPCRYYPRKTTTREIIDNLGYCMTVMMEREKACAEGIAFLANLTDWTMSNFSVSYCHQFMMMLQGRIPVRVRLFLIVNPPSWFGTIWSIMKPMLSSDFRRKVHMIPLADLSQYLEDGYAEFLPDDVEGGKASTSDMVNDFITYRKKVEG